MKIHHYIKKEVRSLVVLSNDHFLFHIIKIAMKLHYGDLNDSSSLVKIIASVKPTEIYNLGAMSHVKVHVLFFFNKKIFFLLEFRFHLI
jgi:GDP-D-mannose dehydratase